MHGRSIRTAQVDADDVAADDAPASRASSPSVVINVALPYQDLHIMDACLAAGVDYLDTANYEPRDVAKFEYKLAVGVSASGSRRPAAWRCSARASTPA